MTIRVAVIGAAGRMGSLACETISGDGRLELVAQVGSNDSLEAVPDAGADVAVELTTPKSVLHNATWLLERGVHVVVGASGLDADAIRTLGDLTGPANCMVIPNFSVGAALMMRFAGLAAVHMPHAEIIEAHHPGKADAPSGTALRTAAMIAQGRRSSASPMGPKGNPARGHIEDDVAVHSVRVPGIVADQQVVFGAEAETLTISHATLNRSSFMPGMLLAITTIPQTPGLVVGLDALL